MKANQQINWQKIVIDLLESGMTQQQLASRCGCDQSYISFVKRGEVQGDVRYGIGNALLKLHKQRCKGKEKPH